MNDSKFIRGILLTGVAILGLGVASVPASAQTTKTANIAVSATVLANCTIGATPLAFGNYDGTVNNAPATINITCTNKTTYTVALNAGTTSGSTTTARLMAGSGTAAGSTLPYALYQDSSHSKNWGNTVGTDTVAGTGNGTLQPLTVNGQIAANQFVTPGSYGDTITASITY